MNKFYFFSTILYFILISPPLLRGQKQAITLPKAGTLRVTLGNESKNLEELTLKGSIDDRDLKFLGTELPKLRVLDLADANIVAFSINGLKFPKDEITAERFLNNKSLEEIVLPKSLKKMGNAVFMNCSKLKKITFGEELTLIGYHLFDNCTSLNFIDMSPTQIRTLSQFTFFNCTHLKEVLLPSIKIIENGAFKQCNSIERLILPTSTQEIQKSVFVGCYRLRELVCKANTPPFVIDTSTFADLPQQARLFVPEEALESYKKDFSWKVFKQITSIKQLSVITPTGEETVGIEIFRYPNYLVIKTRQRESFSFFNLSGEVITRGFTDSNSTTIPVQEKGLLMVGTKVYKIL